MKCIPVILVALLAAIVQASLVHRLPTRPHLRDAPVYPVSRIVNGEQAVRGQFPYQAAVTIDNAEFCGGSLIHPQWVLTAGHCVVDASTWQVTLGQQQLSVEEEGRITLTTSYVILHEDFNPTFLHNDLGLLNLPTTVALTEFIQLVGLPTHSDVDNDYVGYDVTSSGWGHDSDSATSLTDQLKFANMDVISNDECVRTYGFMTINDGKLCCGTSGGGSTCNGDSGGPLTITDNGVPKLIGAVSFGSGEGCEAGAPVGFTRITFYLDWIEDNAGIVIGD